MNKVFISYKCTIDGQPTPDSTMAEELYEELTNSGIESFFAGKTLLEFGSDRYKEQIDAELDNCVVLVVVGTTIENIASRWVKYEWEGFHMDILNGCKKGKVFTYVDGINPHSLPRTLRGVQSFDRRKESLVSIVSFIKNAIISIEEADSTETKESDDPAVSTNPDPKDSVESAYELSSSFLHSGATRLKTSCLECIEAEVAKISSLFKDIHVVKHRDEVVESADIANSIYEIIQKSIKTKSSRLLKIKGPLGSYKNRLFQYLYLLLNKKESGLLPFYIDVAMYEKSSGMQDKAGKKNLESQVRHHFACIKKCIAETPSRLPILIIDGIRDFSSGRDRLYSIIKAELSVMECKLIVSMDTDFTFNSKNHFSLHPVAGTDFEYFIRIKSLSTYYKEKSVDFIKNCIDVFHIDIPYEGVDAYAIYDYLVDLGVISMDAYWLKNLLAEMLGNILNKEITIADLYEAICLREIDSKMLSEAAQLAYEYEYGNIDFSESDFYFDKRWKVIRKHRTVLEYLIARYYIHQFSQLDYQNSEAIKEQLHFFGMVLPRSVVVFIKPMFKRFDDFENKVFSIAQQYYDRMSSFERNQLVYWLGRIKSRVRKEECKAFLRDKWTEQRDQLLQGENKNDNQRKNDSFLYRTLSVSLIVQGEKDVAVDYFDSLLNDKLCNEINRGFHLTYYGDNHYIPNKTTLDLYDETKHGISTFDSLCVSIEAKKKAHVFDYLLILDLFTACSLLQARVEANNNKTAIFKPYAIKTIDNLTWVLTQRRMREFENVRNYFVWILGELKKYYIDGEKYYQAGLLSIFEKAQKIKRSGWINRSVPDPENIVEHMYSCWLIGVLFLPDRSSEETYDKNQILNMLLMHDLGESKTGDIPRPEKQANRQYYDEQENIAMQELFLSRTYPNNTCLASYADCWDQWYKAEGLNALIAKDIDTIQALYQYCCYYMKSEIVADSEDLYKWFDELYDVSTVEGRRIVEILILKNPVFKSIVDKYGRTMEEYYG